jgi:hypothetical protein
VTPRAGQVADAVLVHLLSQLRRQGVLDLQGLGYVLFEAKGGLTVVRRADDVGATRILGQGRAGRGVRLRREAVQEVQVPFSGEHDTIRRQLAFSYAL